MKEKKNFFSTISQLSNNNKIYHFFDIKKIENLYQIDINKLPFSLKIILENLLRFQDKNTNISQDIKEIFNWTKNKTSKHEISFFPTRVLMQDFTGIPTLIDLVTIQEKLSNIKKNTKKTLSFSIPTDLIIDHSITVNSYNSLNSLSINESIEAKHNKERYKFLKWAKQTFSNFHIIPPGTGICHQINLEYLAKVIWTKKINNKLFAFPDSVIGTDSHTTMINSLGILGWGVGGIEAETAILGYPISIIIPEIIGIKIIGKLNDKITSTDVALTITKILREKEVIGKFIEFYGPSLKYLSIPDRATISNMAPEYGATCAIFPIDQETLNYLFLTKNNKNLINLVKNYCKSQKLWYEKNMEEPIYTDFITINLSTINTSISGPKKPEDLNSLKSASTTLYKYIKKINNNKITKSFSIKNQSYSLKNGHIIIAAITSCTNTSNPFSIITAGILAKNAINKGLNTQPWVKTSFAPGSKVVTKYLQQMNLQTYLDKLGFSIVGYGCTTCIGNTGPISKEITKTIQNNNIIVCSVLSGNRNFEGRIHPLIKMNWLCSPPLVIAYALCGSMLIDLSTNPIGINQNGNKIYLKDIWPSQNEILSKIKNINNDLFHKEYINIYQGNDQWKSIIHKNNNSDNSYQWSKSSTYIQKSPFLKNFSLSYKKTHNIIINNAYILAIFGDSITTDHISPAGSIPINSPAGKYLISKGIKEKDFNSYGSRRGNHKIMIRGTFSNIRIQNEIIPNILGGFTKHLPSNQIMSIYEASKIYKKNKQDLIIIAGKNYGTGSSRDWAAKGTSLLGIKAIIAESFERIHRSNLIGMGVLPLQFTHNMNRLTLKLNGEERISIHINSNIKPNDLIKTTIKYPNNKIKIINLICRIDTINELNFYLNGGILKYVLKNYLKQ
ncbi:aconitate hydratase AcnA [Candidatus Legionella polyplacis]|uniref:Aconitate hydratase n=1 Tax=Candidatus Legionella polyplacis TaxID=2005262 RepID=A0ABZ2H0P6_9GAMM